MIWATITLLFIIIFYSIICKDNSEEHNKKIYIIVCGITLVLFSAGRTIQVGTDVYGYMNSYLSMGSKTYMQIWNSYLDGAIKDGGYDIIAKLCYDIGIPFRLFLTMIATLYTYSVCSLIYRYSPKPYISIALWFTLTWFMFSLSGLRQTIAMSLAILAFLQVKEKHVIKGYILIAISILIHTSAVAFAPFYFIDKLKIRKKTFAVLSVLSIFLPRIADNQFRKILSYFSWNSTVNQYLDTYTSINWTGFIIQLSILIFCYLAYDSVCERNPELRGIYALSTIGLLIQPFSQLVAEIFRVSMYYSIFTIVLVPNSLVAFQKKDRLIIEVALIAVIFLYFWVSSQYSGYSVCWL